MVATTPNPRLTPPTNQRAKRAATCAARDSPRRGRSQFRNQTSTQWPPNENQRTRLAASGHTASLPNRQANMPPTTSAMPRVRDSVAVSGSRYGCHADLIVATQFVKSDQSIVLNHSRILSAAATPRIKTLVSGDPRAGTRGRHGEYASHRLTLMRRVILVLPFVLA